MLLLLRVEPVRTLVFCNFLITLSCVGAVDLSDYWCDVDENGMPVAVSAVRARLTPATFDHRAARRKR